ncbi:GH92 family glycosyl hydrolase [Edaphobacter modestus]|uniref:Putative alpha-1,2-mannosidase n=1 Tax=Edaphobacter modestus TaxID=388466 RepID=A0A4Q7YRA0_9BACT|nr:GH92 family glycosyl hydrolase [Edaphobacter modestus]RZU40010.1 putative alpha-1,2-mannosidase [Edaphobacter modestus]
MAKIILLFLCLASFPLSSYAQAVEDLVHPLVGTEREGQTYPAVGVPFAMTNWTPQTRAGETKCIAPYYFTDAKIQGFRGSHFLSGSCVPDYGSITLMPGIGEVMTGAVERASSFERVSERATPYEYTVHLTDSDVIAQITGTTRSGMMLFRFSREAKQGWIVIENNSRGGDGWVHIDPAKREITAKVPVRREYAGSGKLAGFSTYFVIQFDRAFRTEGTWVGGTADAGNLEQDGDGKPPGVITIPAMMTSTGGASAASVKVPTGNPRGGFGAYILLGEVKGGEAIKARIGTSFVSLDGARRNLHDEIPDWNYAAVRDKARSQWHRELSKIEIRGTSPERTVFYTSLYHAMLHPRTYSDVDGSYPRFASDGKIEPGKGFVVYGDFSLWDTFRAQLPLLTIIDPSRDSHMMKSLVLNGTEGGYLPIFPAWNSYTSEMVGDHASVAIIDAFSKGIRGFDIQKAYELMRRNATEKPVSRQEYLDGKGRRGLDSYLRYGYIPLEDHIEDAFHKNEQVSRTLEYSYDDAMLARIAAVLGKQADAALFSKHGENWRNVVDPQTGFARGRYKDGSWATLFDPAGTYSWITEGLPWQYTFFVPQNVSGLIELEGGKEKFVDKLDKLFDEGHYEHGNEPSHHIAYLYNAAGVPWKTQERVRALMDSEYHDGPGGLAGNDDAGQMSAWYVLSALGWYEVCPGIPEYSIGSPRFDDMRVHFENGRALHIVATGTESGKRYVRQVLLNGRKINNWKLTHAQIQQGGELRYEMTPLPEAAP